MTFTKKEAIVYLSNSLGSADGNFSDEEKSELAKSSYMVDIINSFDMDLLLECAKNGTLNDISACYILKDLDFKEKIELFAAFILIISVDLEATPEESKLLAGYQELIGFEDLDLAISRWKELR
jgi:hypothetical protein